MNNVMKKEPKKLHYAWFMGAVTFVVLLLGAGIRATPSVLIVPIENEFGWSAATISAAIGLNILLFGLIGPFAIAVMERFGHGSAHRVGDGSRRWPDLPESAFRISVCCATRPRVLPSRKCRPQPTCRARIRPGELFSRSVAA